MWPSISPVSASMPSPLWDENFSLSLSLVPRSDLLSATMMVTPSKLDWMFARSFSCTSRP